MEKKDRQILGRIRTEMSQFTESYLIEIARRTIQEGGSASKPSSCSFLPIQDQWCFPKYPARTSILPPSVDLVDELRNFISRNVELLNEDDCWLGTWVNPQTGEYYLDVSTGIEDQDIAVASATLAGKKEGRDVVAIFNPKQNRTIFLKPS